MKQTLRKIMICIMISALLVTSVSIQQPKEVSAATTYNYTKSLLFNIMKQDPAMFLQTDYAVGSYAVGLGKKVSTDIKNKAVEITAGCKNNNEKINKVAHWVADYITYSLTDEQNVNTVFQTKRGACSSYARLAYAMLQSLKIPNLTLRYLKGAGHEYNMAYDGNRWIIFDSTWMKTGNSEKYYDMSYEYLFSIKSHTLYEEQTPFYDQVAYFKGCVGYVEKKNTIYRFPYGSTMTSWYMSSGNNIATDHLPALSPKLVSVELPNIKKINSYYFEGLSSVQKVTMYHCEEIGNNAFSASSSLKEIMVPASVKTIGEDAFWLCENLTVKCIAGSYAEQYCIKNKIKHEAIQLKNPVKSISINAKDMVYTPSKNQVQLSAAVAPAGANAKVAWSVETPSNDYGFAKITKDGKLTALYPGYITLVATATDGTGIQTRKTIKLVKGTDKVKKPAKKVIKKKISKIKITKYSKSKKRLYGVTIKKAKVSVKIGKKTYRVKSSKKGKFTVKLKKKLKKKTKITVTVSKSGYKTRKRTFRIK